MLYIFYDDQRVVQVLSARYVLSYTDTSVTLAPDEPGPAQVLAFGSRCKLLRDSGPDCCGMLAWKGIDTSRLDDFILAQYRGPSPEQAPAAAPST